MQYFYKGNVHSTRANLCELREVNVLRNWSPDQNPSMSGKKTEDPENQLESFGIDMTKCYIEGEQQEAATIF